MRAELIGRVNPNIVGAGTTPDLHSVTRTPEELDKQARLLEISGASRVLGAVVKAVPGTSFCYSDLVGIYPGGVRPGYVLERELTALETKGESRGGMIEITISSNGTLLEVSSAKTLGSTTRYRSDGPSFRSLMDRADLFELVNYMVETGFITDAQRPAISAELARNR